MRYPRKKHILVREEHRNDPENLNLLTQYKKDNIFSLMSDLPVFTKSIRINFHCDCINSSYKCNVVDDPEEVTESSVYILQTISISGENFNIFFDTGCVKECKKEAISRLEHINKASSIVQI